MARLLIPGLRGLILIALGAASSVSLAQPGSGDHQWSVDLDLALNSVDTRFEAWTQGGLGKLRYDERDDRVIGNRLFAQYRGRIGETVWGNVVLDFLDDADAGADVTEAYIDWRPLPKSRNKHHFRFGAFYPPFSLENGGRGWSNRLTISSSAINTWLGEEIRPVGVHWSMRRRLGFAGSPHELSGFASAFYGNDPAGTLLFWRGWSLHDRQSRLNDELPLPTIPLRDGTGAATGSIERELEPFHEIDGRPGFYAGIKWQYARRAALQLAHYDNRADPLAFSRGQWGWRTDFTHVSAQLSLPWRLGLVAQWLTGETEWLRGGQPDGRRAAYSGIVLDELDSYFLLLTRPIREAHTVSIRYDLFDYKRPATVPEFVADSGNAWTVAYRYRRSPRLALMLEWLTLESRRDVWSAIFAAQPEATEQQLQLKATLSFGSGLDR